MLHNLVKSMYIRGWVLPRIHRTYNNLSVAETFQNIYRTKAWGDNGEPFCSGGGSRGPVFDKYCTFVTSFIHDHHVQSIVDLGCGDFSVGKQIVEASGACYTGIDVVPELIEHHKSTVQHRGVRFQCADITNDPLPAADLCLVRQVLQHLSNGEIVRVLANLRNFSRILISEDVPVHPKSFNRDKPHGPDVRSYFGSGVYVERPPFSRPVSQLWEFPLTDNSLLRTVLIDQTASGASQG
jgi:2-polyprenyl-3-methyl-5-hydroxy-6-metoxy-1,4-benzoquinol methylase